MSKVIKILVSLLSYLILGAIIIPIALALLLQVNLVQNYVVDQATSLISKKLETEVSIGRIDIRFINSLVIEDLYIADYQKDTLIYIKKIKASIENVNLMRGGFALGDVSLSDVEFNLIQREVGVSNLKQILMRLKRPKSGDKKEFKLNTNSLEVNNLNFIYKKINPIDRDYGVNFGDLEITNLRLEAQDISIIDGSISAKIDDITFNEKSGFNLDALSASKLILTSKGIGVDDIAIDAAQSKLNFKYVKLISNDWKDYSDFVNRVVVDAKVVDSKIAFSSIAYFAPSLKTWKGVLNGVNLSMSGTIADVKGDIYNVTTEQTHIKAKYSIKGLPNIKNTIFTLDMDGLQTSAKDVKSIMEDITNRPFKTLDKFESHLDQITITGKFDGKLTNFSSDFAASTKYGVVNLNAMFTPDTSSTYKIEGHLNTDQFRLGGLFGSKEIGRVSFSTTLSGNIGMPNIIDLKTDAKIELLEYKQYSYSNIEMAGTWRDRMFIGTLSCADPNLDFSFDGALDFSSDMPKYNFELHLKNADLKELNLNNRDTISIIAFDVHANASGTNLDNINGKIEVRSLEYNNYIDTVKTKNIVLVGENSENSKYLALNSTFADIEFRSKTSYRKLFDYVKAVVNTYLPNIREKEKINNIVTINGGVSNSDNYSLLKVNVKETTDLTSILLPGLYIAEGTQTSLLLNTEAKTVAIYAKSDYIEYNSLFVSGLNINTRNQGDSLILYVGAKELYAGAIYMPNFSIIGGAKKNTLNLAAKFNDSASDRGALIGLSSFVERNSVTSVPQLRVKFNPSYFKDKLQTWSIFSDDIIYDTTGISVGDFRIVNENQELSLNGVASKSVSDTLKVGLSNFNLAPFSKLTETLGYKIGGTTSGEVYLISALKNGFIDAGILFDSISINDTPIPSVMLNSSWDFQRERVKVELLRRDNRDALIVGYYSPIDKRYRADVSMNDVSLSLLDPLLKGVIESTKGDADLDIIFAGTGGKFSFNGGISASNMSTLVAYTNVKYNINTAYVEVKDSRLALRNAKVSDSDGNEGDFSLNLDLRNFKNVNFDIKILPNNLMVLNTNVKQNSMFYGTVYASGAATIKGDKKGVNMDITATTAGNSKFFLPLSDKSNASVANFIVFEDPDKVSTKVSNTLQRRKIMFKRKTKSGVSNASNINISLAINVLPNTALQVLIDPRLGDAIGAKGNGQFNLTINPNKNIFTMVGDYEITSGSYMFSLQNIINKKFIIESGSTIKWTGDPINALLDITALYKLKTSLTPLDSEMRGTIPVECQIFLKDRLSQPSVTFGVTILNADPEVQNLVGQYLNTQEMITKQFIYLLAINSFYADGSGNIGAAVGSATGFELLTSQISNWISSDKFNIGIRYTPKGDMSSDEVNVDFSTHLFSNRFLLEVEGNYDSQNNPTSTTGSTTPVRGDFYLTWLIDRNENLKAKIFSRTIDSFDETDGLQESGIGIYYKESFNVFKDVIESVKERFSYTERKRRQKLRLEKRAKKSEISNNN